MRRFTLAQNIRQRSAGAFNIGRFGGGPQKVFLKGHSAGARIAAMLSIDARWLAKVGFLPGRDIAGLIGIAGPYDDTPLRDVDAFIADT